MRIEAWLDEAGGPRWWARALSFAAVVGALLGIIGPFGSYLNDGVLMRVLYWSGVTVAAVVIAGVMVPPLMRVGLRVGLPWLFSLVVAMAIADVPIAVLSTAIVHWLWAWQVSRLGPADFYSQTLLMSFCVLGLWLLLEQARKSLRWAEPAPSSVPLPVRVAKPVEPVLCLQMEDHYVRVHRASGSSLELMPLHEAVRRFGTADGLQVHRSWWVAGTAVAQVERDVRNWRLRLTNGTTVPVARNRIAAVRARGWLNGGEPAQAADGQTATPRAGPRPLAEKGASTAEPHAGGQ